MKTALLASYSKDGALLSFAARLIDMGWSLLASQGTAEFLNKNNVPAKDVAEMVGPPMLGHRVVTLAREVYAGVLANYNEEDVAELTRLDLRFIDLVYVNLYPLGKELENPDRTESSVRKKIDIGGPTLLRAAAKGNRIVVSDPVQFQLALDLAEVWPAPLTDGKRTLGILSWEAERAAIHHASLTERFYYEVKSGFYEDRARE